MEQKATARMELSGKGLSLHFKETSKVVKPSKKDKGDLKTPLLPLHAVLVCEPGCFGAAWALRALKDAHVPMSCTRSHGTEPAPSAASQPGSQEEDRGAGKALQMGRSCVPGAE